MTTLLHENELGLAPIREWKFSLVAFSVLCACQICLLLLDYSAASRWSLIALASVVMLALLGGNITKIEQAILQYRLYWLPYVDIPLSVCDAGWNEKAATLEDFKTVYIQALPVLRTYDVFGPHEVISDIVRVWFYDIDEAVRFKLMADF